jgi:hypothetical protein
MAEVRQGLLNVKEPFETPVEFQGLKPLQNVSVLLEPHLQVRLRCSWQRWQYELQVAEECRAVEERMRNEMEMFANQRKLEYTIRRKPKELLREVLRRWLEVRARSSPASVRTPGRLSYITPGRRMDAVET